MLGFDEQRAAFAVGGEDNVEQAVGAARRFLQKTADAGALAHGDGAGFRRKIAGDDIEERGLAGAVAADQADAAARGHPHRGVVDQQASGDADGEVFDRQHGRALWPIVATRSTGLLRAAGGRFPRRAKLVSNEMDEEKNCGDD